MTLCTEQQIQTALGHLSPEIFELTGSNELRYSQIVSHFHRP